MTNIIYRYLLIFIACLSIVLGVLGVFLPVLPTTPFLILALACFSRSSPYLHKKLLTTPYIGEVLQDWEADKKITTSRKKKIYLTILVTFLISILLLKGHLLLQLLLLLILTLLLLFIARIPEK
ncbi:YbaN family protein [Psychromonas sp. MME2]|uniref:YbaN family protein n=1 Tax=Psychromonas sp. MME2 TaxID=3231033 RepID=UPI00339CC530